MHFSVYNWELYLDLCFKLSSQVCNCVFYYWYDRHYNNICTRCATTPNERNILRIKKVNRVKTYSIFCVFLLYTHLWYHQTLSWRYFLRVHCHSTWRRIRHFLHFLLGILLLWLSSGLYPLQRTICEIKVHFGTENGLL